MPNERTRLHVPPNMDLWGYQTGCARLGDTVRTESSSSFAQTLYHNRDGMSIPFWKNFCFFFFWCGLPPIFVCTALSFLSRSSKIELFIKSATFIRHWRYHWAKATKKAPAFWIFFYCVTFSTNFSTKNRLFWTFTNRTLWGIIITL